MMEPLSNRPKITLAALKSGFVTRYFVKNVSTNVITEVDLNQYNSFKKNPYFQTIELPWAIMGTDNDTYDSGGMLVKGTRTKNLEIIDYYSGKMKGLRAYLPNPLQFFSGKSIPVTPPPEKKPETEPEVFFSPNLLKPILDPIRTLRPREYQSEFAISPYLANSSITLRPDAVSFDYLTTFTLGPKNFGDPSEGVFADLWKVRADDSSIRYARVSGSGWEEEQVLFTYTGKPIVEFDAAFEQLGRLNFVAQRNTGVDDSPEVWVYWFNPFTQQFVFENFGEGRTPRMSLDDWQTPENSDILVFYINDTADRIQYRVQRDQFDIVYNTPITSSQNTYIEEVGFGSDYRYRVTYVERNPLSGKYELFQLASKAYPIKKNIQTEPYFASASALNVQIQETLLTRSLFNSETYFASASALSVSVQQILLTSSREVESYFASASIISLTIDVP